MPRAPSSPSPSGRKTACGTSWTTNRSPCARSFKNSPRGWARGIRAAFPHGWQDGLRASRPSPISHGRRERLTLAFGANLTGRHASPPAAKGSTRSSPRGMPNLRGLLLRQRPADERTMMSTCAGPTCPEQQNRKTCEACGQEFLCQSMDAGCWCEEIHLTDAAREEISHRFRDCLCRNCLGRFQAKDGYMPRQNQDSI
jgi:hypothetical protein